MNYVMMLVFVTNYFSVLYRESSDGVDIVLDCLCGDDTNKGIAILKPMGKYILFGMPCVFFFFCTQPW